MIHKYNRHTYQTHFVLPGCIVINPLVKFQSALSCQNYRKFENVKFVSIGIKNECKFFFIFHENALKVSQ